MYHQRLSSILKELQFKTSRSSGAGGQHVNKVASRVTLVFDLMESKGLSADQKMLLQQKLKSRLSKDGILLMHCAESRSQHRNKQMIIKRFLELLKINLISPKKRKRTTPTKAVIRKRLEDKKRIAQKKSNRKRFDF